MIELKNLYVDLQDFILNDISLTIPDGSFFAVMGPTGAGKTVLLETISGLIPVKSGTIYCNGNDITSFPPEKRNIAIVYQDYALFPNMTVEDNITYGLRYHTVEHNKSNQLMKNLINKLQIKHLLQRRPSTLSGGELQRVAIARSLIIAPSVVLLDEPLSSVDPSLRGELQEMLRELHQSTETTFVLVTHNFAEALSLCDNAVILNEGSIEQQGPIKDIFMKPRSEFTASFVGMHNIFPVQFKGDQAISGNLSITILNDERSSHESGFIAIRPEDIVLSNDVITSTMRNSFEAKILSILDCGISCEVYLTVKDLHFRAHITRGALHELNLNPGDSVYLYFKATAVHSF